MRGGWLLSRSCFRRPADARLPRPSRLRPERIDLDAGAGADSLASLLKFCVLSHLEQGRAQGHMSHFLFSAGGGCSEMQSREPLCLRWEWDTLAE
jgi:hypothetical protein